MKISLLRTIVQFFSFILLTYGGYLGLRLGHFLPCFSCPYVGGCGGHCYLMALQGYAYGTQISFSDIVTVRGLKLVGMFGGFVVLVILLSKKWCGWICPFGTVQDGITFIRKKFGIRKSLFSWDLREKLKSVKYILLALLVVIPLLIANAGLHTDFQLPFCQICPAKIFMPVFEGNFRYFAIDFTNTITLAFTSIALVLAAIFLVGMIFKERLFCIFCPLLALISLFDKLGFPQLKKEVSACSGCGTCKRVCPMEIQEVHQEKEKENVISQDCILCGKCVESCPGEGTLSVKYLNKSLFSSSKEYIKKYFVKK